MAELNDEELTAPLLRIREPSSVGQTEAEYRGLIPVVGSLEGYASQQQRVFPHQGGAQKGTSQHTQKKPSWRHR